MLREIILLVIGALFGLGATMAALAAPAHYTNIPPSIWHWLFWCGMALMALMLVDAGCLVFWRPRFSTGILLNIGLASLAAAATAQYAPVAIIQSSALPLTISQLQEPSYSRNAWLAPEDNLAHDPAIFSVPGVFISNFSPTRSVTLRLFLVMRNKQGAEWVVEGTGIGPFGRIIGQYKHPLIPWPGPGLVQPRYILSPVTLPPQQTASGDLAFVTEVRVKDDFWKEAAEFMFRGIFGPIMQGGSADEKFTYTLRITDVVTDTTIEISLPSAGYKGN
jgi:hypothetical protein